MYMLSSVRTNIYSHSYEDQLVWNHLLWFVVACGVVCNIRCTMCDVDAYCVDNELIYYLLHKKACLSLFQTLFHVSTLHEIFL